jgi:hypothetical protein
LIATAAVTPDEADCMTPAARVLVAHRPLAVYDQLAEVGS